MDIDRLSDMAVSAAGLVALADLPTVAWRTVLRPPSLLDCLIICPVMHRQQDAPRLNAGEYPICAAMTTDYIFRIENQATVAFLQRIGRPGQLTTLQVSAKRKDNDSLFGGLGGSSSDTSLLPGLCYIALIAMTVATVTTLYMLQDWWGFFVLLNWMLVRLVNTLVMLRRARQGWKGEPEPGQQSDLLILASQDRWIRIKGAVDDVKAVTSGEWLREFTLSENAFVAFATLLTYANAGLASNSSPVGQVVLLVLLCSSGALLGLANEYTDSLAMYGRVIERVGPRTKYKRRLELAEQLIAETGREDWAIKLGMIQRSGSRSGVDSADSSGGATDAAEVIREL